MRGILAACALAAAAGVANGQLVVGNDQSGVAPMYYIDVESGVATQIYASSTAESKPWGMAYDSATNTLYWNNGSNLYSSPFSTEGLTPTLLGGMTFNAATVNFVALAFRDGKLLGTRNIATEAVYEINVETRVATQLYVYPTAFDFGGLDVDVTNGVLYGLTDTAPAGQVRGLYEINVPAQTTTFLAPYPGTETDIDGLAVYNGKAYYVTDGPNTVQQFFYIYDVVSGNLVGTLPSPFTGSGTFSAATYIDPPGTGCDPDYTGDGNVDQDDIACLAQIVAGDRSCSLSDPDFNGDGNVDQDDIDVLAQVVAGAECP